ncbi:MAG: primosomal protein N' [Rhodospirillales bacterium]|jgi:primosomal protein N' (replication factor Y)|nr:primosomal protein N' [Rhodospirillaceae bacterium]MBT6218488.1 primosomal protein N' [Rhodospirillaceae bacterium]MBT7768551.1 primosomal protein N' [Rhodospirillales bacterium]MBT8001861.1 primosomal protein N' [Rhodospirillales bacterium]
MSSSRTSFATPTEYGPGERVSVLLPLPLAGAYDYRVPESLVLHNGDIVLAPLGVRRCPGVVWGDAQGAVDNSKLKEIISVLEAPPVPDVSRRFVDWIAAYTCSPPGAVLKMVISVPDALEPPKPVTAYHIHEPLDPTLKLTAARKRVLEVLTGGPPRRMADLAREAGCGPAVIKGLAEKGVLAPIELSPAPLWKTPEWDRVGPDLSVDQSDAAEKLIALTQDRKFSVTLLDGVPGSGKTEVYFQAVAKALEQGHQVLVLLPEIALSAQWLERFEARFGVVPAQWHSDLTQTQRRTTWRDVAEDKVRVLVGARSALLLPYPDLGLVVVDEEHETSFKQEDGVIYNARDMAVVRAQLGNVPIILASATPSLETVVNVGAGKYGRLHLPERHAGASMPDVDLIDMRTDKLPSGTWLSPKLTEAIQQKLEGGQQAMLFLNRRGYAPLTLCRTCGHRLQCPRCTAWLVEHRGRGATRLLCHHCGFGSRVPEACPGCEDEASFVACGPGVERLAEEAAEAFPDARRLIAASDTVQSPAEAAELVKKIEDHQVDLIIGTQIVAKGYHFPLLTLVGVVDADLGLAGGDLRAAERTYQLLYQVAGRAGRAEQAGRVVLQTYMPDHPVMQALASGERDQFIEVEQEARRVSGMPPFGRLAALIVSGRDEASVDGAARELGRVAPLGKNIRVLGPAPAPLAMLRGRHRQRLLLQTARDVNVQSVIGPWLASAKIPRNVRVQVDVDPYSFF